MTGDTMQLLRRVSGEGARRLTRTFRSGPFYTLRSSGTAPARVLALPDNLRPQFARPAEAQAVYAGLFRLAGEEVNAGQKALFELDHGPDHWHAAVHGFQWLGHLAAADTPLARANGSQLVMDWIGRWEQRSSPLVWRGDVAAARLMSWLRHGPAVFSLGTATPQAPVQHRFLRSLARHARFLSHNAGSTRDGLPRLQARIALVMAATALEGRDKLREKAVQALDLELERQVLSDGGHVSRNPAALLEALSDLLPLREIHKTRGIAPSARLVSSIDRMMDALRALRHADGRLAQFNGTGPVDEAHLSGVLRHDAQASDPPTELPATGYDRLAGGRTVVLVESGRIREAKAAPSAMAGTGSFELSSDAHSFIINCGMPGPAHGDYAPYARATAAHSTLVVSDTSSSRFSGSGRAARMMAAASATTLLAPPPNVTRERRDSAEQRSLTIGHDGYRSAFGLTHSRHLVLSRDGRSLDGQDSFHGSDGTRGDVPIVLRFHIAPGISVSQLGSGISAVLLAPDGDSWTFTCIDAPFRIDESVRFDAAAGPRRCQQLVVETTIAATEVRWTLRRGKRSGQRKPASAKVTKPMGDLLAVLDYAPQPHGDGRA